MEDKCFNLTEEPWIKVMMPDCRMREVSLPDVLIHAHEYRDLSGEMKAQDVAILRMLIAVVHTIFTRVDISGDIAPVEDEKDALERWKSLWDLKHFPEEPVKDYLQKWKERFWLFHPERPFYQVATLGKATEYASSKLNGEISESGNKKRLFASFSRETYKMSFPESARWLLFINAFDDCAGKQQDKSEGTRSSTVGWLGKLGIITVVGNNLFETIMLNMTMFNASNLIWEEDVPTWELDHARTGERVAVSIPQNMAELFTLQSRRILLTRENSSVIGYREVVGDEFEQENALNEPMTLWKWNKEKGKQAFKPCLHEREKQVWRDFGLIAGMDQENHKRRPGVIEWCDYLRRKRVLTNKNHFTICAICTRYDSKQSSCITDSFTDEISFHADLLNEVGTIWRDEVIKQIDKIDKVAEKIKEYADDLRIANGIDKDKRSELNENDITAMLWYQKIDNRFREWILKLDPVQTNEERTKIIVEWEIQARNLALKLGQELALEQNNSAFIGRDVKNNGKNTFRYSVPKSYNFYRNRIYEIYKNMREGETKDVE